MAKTPKTLQVRFGSFSCTLEGFDDPVQALRSVTEYVRDLSGRDPDFAARLGLVAPPREPDAAPVAPPVAPRAMSPMPEVHPAPSMPPAAARPAAPAMPAPQPEDRAPEDRAIDVAVGLETVEAPPLPDPSEMAARPAPAAAMPPEAAEDTTPPEPPVEAAFDPEEHPGLHLLLSADPEDEEEIDRFLSRADDQLADPEAARRRDVIAQLKAAVAATEAERAYGDPDPGPGARAEAFRSDLSDEIRAQAPAASPLRLVASQRVDEGSGPEGEALDEVRAVMALAATGTAEAAEAAPSPSTAPRGRPQESFAGFASEMGAASMADLIEAAAAWLCFVDEAESVSRTQLLALVTEAVPVVPDREEGLRAFGTLLRQGRLTTVAGGRYRISQESRFNPGRLAV